MQSQVHLLGFLRNDLGQLFGGFFQLAMSF